MAVPLTGKRKSWPSGLMELIARAVSAFQASDIRARTPVLAGKSAVAAVRRRRPSLIV